MPATEQGKVRQRGRAPVGPVAEVMPLGEAESAPREAAALVPMVERPPQGGRNRPCPSPDLAPHPGSSWPSNPADFGTGYRAATKRWTETSKPAPFFAHPYACMCYSCAADREAYAPR